MNSYNKKQKSGAILIAAAILSLTGCYERPYYAPQPVAQQMTQQCGQSMQTGQVECIAVPVGAANPYAYPAPRQYYSDHGIGYGTVLGAAALAGTAGYLAGRNSGTSNQGYQQAPATTTYSNAAGQRVNSQTVPAGNPAPAFKSQAAATMTTAKPMSIPPSAPAARPVAAPISLAKPSFTPSRAAPVSLAKPSFSSARTR